MNKNRLRKIGLEVFHEYLRANHIDFSNETILYRSTHDKKFSFTTDKLAAYLKGFNKYFLHVAEIKHGVSITFKKYGLKHNNNCIERDHQYSRRLESNARGHKSFDGANALFNLGDVYYNFIDKQRLEHERRWRTPAQRATITLFLGGKHQLLNLIRLASIDN
ncbi:MAG: hypothetical protein AABW75_05145 [Nanoarchaeota archaeon]